MTDALEYLTVFLENEIAVTFFFSFLMLSLFLCREQNSVLLTLTVVWTQPIPLSLKKVLGTFENVLSVIQK